MKKYLLAVVVLLGVLAYVYRQRLYLRDFLGSVSTDGVAQETRIYINASNDVVLETGGLIGTRSLVQHGNLAPGYPVGDVTCEWRVLCFLDADKVTLSAIDGEPANAHVVMTSKLVTYVDENGKTVSVKLR